MAKDSIEQKRAKSVETALVEVLPPIIEGTTPTAEPVVEIVTEQNNENNIDAKTESAKNTETSEPVGTDGTAKKVRKTTQGNKGRKGSANGEVTKTTTSRTRKTKQVTKAASSPVISNEEVTTPLAIVENKENLEPISTMQDEEATNHVSTTQTAQDPIIVNDREKTPTDNDTQNTKDNTLDEPPAQVTDTSFIPDSTSQEPTIIAEPIGAGATIDVVTATTATTDDTPSIEIDNDQHSEAPTVVNPVAEVQQEEITADVVDEVAEEQQLAKEPAISDAQNAEKQRSSDRRELMKSASLVSIGNFGSSVLGMLRQVFIAGAGAPISGPFLAALTPAQKFNDFIVNGSVPGALIPTFNDYAAPEKREELRRLMFTLVNLVIIVMAGASIIFFFIAPWVTTHVLATSFTADEQPLTTRYSQIIFLSLLALGPFAVLQAGLFARKEFGWPAFATGAYHVGIIIGAGLTAIIGTHFVGGRYGIAFGVLLGAVGEIGLLIPGFRNQKLSYMFVLDLKHPALRRILKLYAPIAFSFFVSACFALFDQSLATKTACMAVMHQTGKCGDVNWSAMQFATTLIQFPGGLVASALMFAVLPSITTHIREGNTERFKSTLLLGFRLGLLLMIPAAAGLIVLQLPIISLIFEHGKFTHQQSIVTATALQNYAYQLPFTAIDQLLIAAFYARKNTIIPVAVGAISYLGYLAVALPFWQTVGMPALPLANSTQIAVHTIILLVLLRMAIGPMHLGKLIPTLAKLLLAAAVMVAVAWGLQMVLAPVLAPLPPFIERLITVIFVGAISAGVYFGIVILLKVEEVTMLKGAVMAKLGKK
jgi:putative peptidoglycan lipid II flippase